MGIAFGVTVVGTAAGAVGALASCGPLGPAIAVGVIVRVSMLLMSVMSARC